MDHSAQRPPRQPQGALLRCQACGASYPVGTPHTCPHSQTATVRLDEPAPPSPSQSEGPDPLLGQVIGERYHVLSQIGRGGMGAVFKARHVSLNSFLAIKVLLKADSPSVQQDVLREAQLASKTHHPNIVQIMDFGLLPDHRPYLVMEFLEGKTLGSLLKEGPLDLLRTCRIAIQIARGVQAIHEQGIVHRDLKPDNILLRHHSGNADFVKIIDFGIAKDVGLGVDLEQLNAAAAGGTLNQLLEQTAAQSKQKTRYEAMVGTPMYMAPEQVRGRPVDGRCDQYALGIILYQMLTGKPPFLADTLMETIFLRLMQMPPAPRQCSPARGISAELDALTMRCLSLEPAHRFASMNELAEALEREVEFISLARGERQSIDAEVASLHPERLSAAKLARPTQSRLRSRKLLLAGVAGALLLGAVGLGLFLRLSSPRQLTRQELLALEQRAVTVLTDCMTEADTRLRVRALGALADTHDLSLRPKVEPWLRVTYPEVQAEAAATLGALGDTAAATRLAELYQTSTVPIVQMAALRALEQLGDPRGSKFLHEALANRDEESRLYAGLILCEQADPPAVTMLQDLFVAGKLPPPLLLNSLGCLSRAGSELAKEKLVTLTRSAGSRDAQLGAAVQLMQSGDPRGRARLAELSGRPGPEQLIAARLLATPEERESAQLFRSVLTSSRATPEVLVLAMEGLGRSGQTDDVLRLEPSLAAGHPSLIRQTAAGAIVQIAHRDPALLSARSVEWTHSALSDANWMTRLSATTVLGDNSTADAVTLLSRVLKDRESRVRRGAARALGRHKEEPALRALREGVADGDPEVRNETLRSLSRIGPRLPAKQRGEMRREVTAWLAPVLDKGSRAEQILARGVLLRLGDSEQVTLLRPLWTDASDDLRVLAVEQLENEPRELRSFLKDSSFPVRFTTARLLAERGDKWALPVLTDAFSKGGTTALLSYGLLRRLGSTVDLSKESETLLSHGTIEERLSVVQAWAMLPSEQALDLLSRASYHAEPRVRMQVVESLADLQTGAGSAAWLKVLRRLSSDSDPAIRARAGLLVARAMETAQKGQPATPPAPPRPTPAPAADTNPPEEPPSEPITPVTKSTERSGAGVLEEAERLMQQAQNTKDPRKAQKLYDKARQLCLSAPSRSAGTSLLFEIGVRLGRLHEAQDRPAEAMTEYQSAQGRAAQVKGKQDLKSEAQSAIRRLSTLLGRVVMPKQVKGKCREEAVWLPAGTHTLVASGQSQTIKVSAGATVRIGSCK